MSPAPTLVCLSGTSPQPATEEVAVTRMTVRGTRAWIAYRPDQREWRRRQACGLGPVMAWDLLDTLMDFPAGMPVPVAAWTARCGAGSPRRRPAWCASGGRGDPDLVPAVTPLLAVVTTRDWREGLAAASRFAIYCRRWSWRRAGAGERGGTGGGAGARDRHGGRPAGRARCCSSPRRCRTGSRPRPGGGSARRSRARRPARRRGPRAGGADDRGPGGQLAHRSAAPAARGTRLSSPSWAPMTACAPTASWHRARQYSARPRMVS